MSLRNLTSEQLAEDYAVGTVEERNAIREERYRRAEERACRAEDERNERS